MIKRQVLEGHETEDARNSGAERKALSTTQSVGQWLVTAHEYELNISCQHGNWPR